MSNSLRSISFRKRFIWFNMIVVGLSALTITSIAITFFLDEKIETLKEMSLIQAKAISARVSNEIFNQNEQKSFEIKENSSNALTQWKLHRWPEYRELFIALIDNTHVIIGRNKNGTLYQKPFVLSKNPWETDDKIAYMVTTTDLLIGSSNSEQIPKEKIQNRPSLLLYKKSSAPQGSLLLTLKGQKKTAIGFAEISKTNICIIVERELFAELNNFWKQIALIFGAFIFWILLSVFLSDLICKGLYSFLTQIHNVGFLFAKGQYNFEIVHKYNDEFYKTFQMLNHMGQTLKKQKIDIEESKAKLTRLLDSTRQLALVQDTVTAIKLAINLIISNIPKLMECNAWAYLFPEDNNLDKSENRFFYIQVTSRGKNTKSELILGQCLHLSDPITAIKQRKPFVFAQKWHLILPLWQSEVALGMLLFEGFKNEAIAKEDLTFLDAIAASLSTTLKSINLVNQMIESTRLEGELCAVRTLQDNFLPSNYDFPHIELASSFIPADLAGGDWFNCMYNEKEQVFYACLGDVTGHGIPSAMMTGVAFGAFRAAEKGRELLKEQELSLQAGLMLTAEYVNISICSAGKGTFFMSMIFMAIDVTSGKCVFVNAGHIAPLLLSAATGKIRSLPVGGSLLGSQIKAEFESFEIDLSSGDLIFLHSDGLTENQGPKGEVLKRKKLATLLSEGGSPRVIQDRVTEVAKSIWLETPAKDDISSLLICWTEPTS